MVEVADVVSACAPWPHPLVASRRRVLRPPPQFLFVLQFDSNIVFSFFFFSADQKNFFRRDVFARNRIFLPPWQGANTVLLLSSCEPPVLWLWLFSFNSSEQCSFHMFAAFFLSRFFENVSLCLPVSFFFSRLP